MATMPIASFRPAAGLIRASTGSTDEAATRNKGPSRRQAAPASGANWWAPIFGWGSGPDYITAGSHSSQSHASFPDGNRPASGDEEGGAARGATARATAGGGTRGRMATSPVVFTEEKARMLRMKTAEASTFHDAMYHSAIASRLASDFHAHGKGGQGQEQSQGRSGA